MILWVKHHISKSTLRLFGICLFFFIIYKIDLSKILDCIDNVKLSYVTIILLLNFVLVFTKVLRWNSILKIQQVKLTFIDSFLIYYSGLFFGVISPGRLGEFVKASYLKVEKGVPLIKGILSTLIDRLFDMYGLIILGIIGIGQFNIIGKLSNLSFILIIVILLAPILLFHKETAARGVCLLYKFVRINKFKNKIEETFVDYYSEINRLISTKLFFSAILTCLSLLIFFTQCYLLVIAMDLVSMDFTTITVFMAISRLIGLLPISISGLGTRDAMLIYLFSLIGLKPELAVGYSFLIFTTIFVFNGMMGAVAWFIKPIDIKVSKG